MRHQNLPAVPKVLVGAVAAALFAIAGSVSAATPTYTITDVLVPPDQYSGEADLTPAPVWKPHETDSSSPTASFWISSNERGAEEGPPGQTQQFDNMAGITIFEYGTNAVLSTLNIEDACIPVVLPNGTLMKQFGGCAPPGAEGHPRHPHGIEIDEAKSLAWQVIEHSGLQWNATRTGFVKAQNTDVESGMLVKYDISDLANPKIVAAYVTGHATEEAVVNPNNHKVYAGNHEPAATNVKCWVSVVDESKPTRPYKFIDMANNQCVQGVGVDPELNTVNGTTHFGEKMWTFDSATDTPLYSVDLRGPFNAFVASLPPNQRFTIPTGWILHFHDLDTDQVNHRAYNALHTIAAVEEIAEEDEAVEVEGPEITGRWVAAVDTNPASPNFKKVTIIDLSNGQSVPDVPGHHDAVATLNGSNAWENLFIHSHFLMADPANNSLLVSGEHTGNLAVVNTDTMTLQNVHPIARLIPNCTPDELEPHVHGVNIQRTNGTAYVSDEGEHCFYESVTILEP